MTIFRNRKSPKINAGAKPVEMLKRMAFQECLLIFFIFFYLSFPVQAQITLDGTLGQSGSLPGPKYKINADLGQQKGGNLFHSFTDFNLNYDETATFMGPNSVENIISRVTGGNASRIDGLLRSEIPGADFYFLNPAGVMFGPKASLDMSGSFHISTAAYLRLSENGKFDAEQPENTLLTAASPSAFGFLEDGPGEITVEGNLLASEGKTLSLIGGEINITEGFLITQNGQISITSVASSGETRFTDDSGPDISSFKQHGQISLSGGAVTDIGGGKICIQGGKFVVTDMGYVSSVTENADSGGIDIRVSDELQISHGGGIATATLGAGKTGDISASADLITITHSGYIASESGGTGDSGDIRLDANRVDLSGGAISTNTLDSGKAGDISVSADSLSISGNGLLTTDNGNVYLDQDGKIDEVIGGKGESGDIRLSLNHLEMDKGSVSSNSLGNGAAGNILITAGESIHIAGSGTDEAGEFSNIYYGMASKTLGSGNGGHITIETPELHLTEDAVISAQTNGEGQGGDVILDAERVEIHDGGMVTTSTRGSGNSGDISITVGESVSLSGAGARLDKSYIYTGTHSSGSGGKVSISTPLLTIKRDGVIYSGSENPHDGLEITGQGGDIELETAQLKMEDDALISSKSTGTGDAGDIRIIRSNTIEMENSTMTTEAETAGGGKMMINVRDSLLMSGSQMTTSVEHGEKDGGDIQIRSPEFVILNQAKVIARAHQGKGGNIRITAEHFIESSGSKVDASSELGIDGSVDIESPEENVSSSLAVLPDTFPDASHWLKTPCSSRTGEKVSRLVVEARDGLPTPLDDWLASPPLRLNRTNKDTSAGELIAGGEEHYQKGNIASAVRSWEAGLASLNPKNAAYAHILECLAYAYPSLGHYQKPKLSIEKLLPVVEKAGDPFRSALLLSRLGDILLSRGDVTEADAILKKSMKQARMIQNPSLLASVLNNQGNLLAIQEDYGKAVAAYKESLGILRETTGTAFLHDLKSKILINIARTRWMRKDDGKGIVSALNRAVKHIQNLPDSCHKAFDFISVGLFARDIRKDHPQSEDRLGEISRVALEQAKQIAEDIRSTRLLSHAYGHLGEYHLTEERYAEALSLTRRASFFAQQGNLPELLCLWQRQTGKIFKARHDTEKSVRAYSDAVTTLNPIRKEFFRGYKRRGIFYEKVRPVYLELAELLLKQADTIQDKKARDTLLRGAISTMERLKTAEMEDYFEDECVTVKEKADAEPDSIPSRSAVLYPIPFQDHLTLLLMLPDGITRIDVPVSSDELGKHAERLRGRLQEFSKLSRILHYAKPLYDWLIRPMEPELIAQNVDTLILAPDGLLRLIPFNALYDGTRFLVEKYALVTVPSLALTDLRPSGPEAPDVLLNGLSQGRTEAGIRFSPLPAIPGELENIQAMTGGRTLMDEAYTINNLTDAFRGHAYSVVHLATHGVFGRSPEKTFLLTYDSRLTMNQLEKLLSIGRFCERQVELLTLSACQTAQGDERAALGLAGVALKTGAKSAIATLWFIDDQAASLTVREFYRHFMTARMSKAKALQNAQKRLIGRADYRHPSYWAPFLLIGNWL